MIGDVRLRGTGSTRREATVRREAQRQVMGRLRQLGVLRGAEHLNVASDNRIDQLKYHLEKVREWGAPRWVRHEELRALQEDMWQLAHIEPIVGHGIGFRCMLAMGGGVSVSFAGTPKGEKAAAQFAEFDAKTHYLRRRLPKLVSEMMLFGGVLAVHLRPGQNEEGPSTDMRVLDPVTRDGGFDGPVFEKFEDKETGLLGQDVESVKGYRRRTGRLNTGEEKLIPPHVATHWRWREWGTQGTGRPLYEPCHSELWMLRQSMFNSWVLLEWMQRIMSFMVHVEDRKLSEQLKAGDITVEIPNALSAYVVPFGAKMEIPVLKDHLEFGDRDSRGPEYFPERRIAMTLGVPLHFLRMEFNEGNYSSFLSAEGPLVGMGRRDAELIEDTMAEDLEKVLPGFEAGDDYVATVLPMIMRDRDKEMEQHLQAARERIISRRTVQEKFELDPEVEETRLTEEAAARIDALPPGLQNPNGGPPGGEPEDDDDKRATESANGAVQWHQYDARHRCVPAFQRTGG